MILPYQKTLIDQTYTKKSGLWILPMGLGMFTVIEHLLWKLENNVESNKLIIVLNVTQDPLFDSFKSNPPHRFRLLNAHLTSAQR